MQYEDDISAEETPQGERAWFQKENEYQERKKSTGCKEIKRKKETFSLGHSVCGLFFFLFFSICFRNLRRDVLQSVIGKRGYEIVVRTECGKHDGACAKGIV